MNHNARLYDAELNIALPGNSYPSILDISRAALAPELNTIWLGGAV